MSFADDKFLPSRNYATINVGYNRPISFSEEDNCLSSSEKDYPWTILFLANKKWTVQGPLDVFVDIPPYAEDGEDVASAKNPPKPHRWVIKHHPSEAQSYLIYSPSQPHLFWSLQNGNEGTILSADHNSKLSLWKFKKIETQVPNNETLDGHDPINCFSAAPVQRPTQLDFSVKNTFSVTIPAGWLTTITSISCGNCVNLVRIRRVINGVVEKQDFVSGWDEIDKAMMIDGSDSNPLAVPSAEDAYTLVVQAYHSKNRARKDPRNLPVFKD